MNAFRLRLVRLKNLFGVKSHYYAIQASEGGLTWQTVARLETAEEAIAQIRALAEFISNNQLVKEEEVLWETKI